MIKKCLGCGVKLQDSDDTKLGYVKDISKQKYCMRCFKLKNYHEMSSLKPAFSNDEIINLVNKQKGQVIYLVDILNLNSETISYFKKINKKKLLIISKSDIVPKSIDIKHYIDNVRKIYRINDDILTVSGLKNYQLNQIKNFLKNDFTYIMGFTNSGKSTLINALIDEERLLTSNMVNTTLDFIRIETEEYTIFDTPGLLYNEPYSSDLKVLNSLSPKEVLVPLVYQMKPNSGIIIDKVTLFNNSDEGCNLTLYLDKHFKVRKIFKIDNDEGFKCNLKNQDIVIKGLGFFSTKKALDLLIKIDNEKLIEIRPTVFRVMDDEQ